MLGHGTRAFEVYRKTCPAYIEDISEIHRTERPKESRSSDSGGSSTHTSSSGTTHGGGGGSF